MLDCFRFSNIAFGILILTYTLANVFHDGKQIEYDSKTAELQNLPGAIIIPISSQFLNTFDMFY